MDKTSAPSIGVFASALQDPLKWQQLLDHLPCSLVVFDAEARLLLCNAGFRDL